MSVNNIDDVRKISGYEALLAKAIEYDRVYNITQQDPVYKKFLEVKANFKSFCMDNLRKDSPMDILSALFGKDRDFEKKTTDQRVVSKLEKYNGKGYFDKHINDDVIFKADQITEKTLHQLYGQLVTVYDLLNEYVIKDDDLQITHEKYQNVKKGTEGNLGFVKSLKKTYPQFVETPERAQQLKEAFRADGITNPKTFGKVDSIAEAKQAPKA